MGKLPPRLNHPISNPHQRAWTLSQSLEWPRESRKSNSKRVLSRHLHVIKSYIVIHLAWQQWRGPSCPRSLNSWLDVPYIFLTSVSLHSQTPNLVEGALSGLLLTSCSSVTCWIQDFSASLLWFNRLLFLLLSFISLYVLRELYHQPQANYCSWKNQPIKIPLAKYWAESYHPSWLSFSFWDCYLV
jgi:hypothetical protein